VASSWDSRHDREGHHNVQGKGRNLRLKIVKLIKILSFPNNFQRFSYLRIWIFELGRIFGRVLFIRFL
jgi:hypothetical protein